MKPVYVESVGLFAPGLIGWADSLDVLSGKRAHALTAAPKLAPVLLPAAIRRRSGDFIRLAAQVADEAVQAAGADPAQLPSVFACSDSDGAIAHAICEAVAMDEPMVSPTMFHNSVTNAPAGYWCIAVGSQQPSTSVSGFDGSFAVGLAEAMTQMQAEACDMLLVCHDVKFPEPLNTVRPMLDSFGSAMVLSRQPTDRSLASLSFAFSHGEPETSMDDTGLEALRIGNPAGRALPVLAAIARQRAQIVVLPYMEGMEMVVEVAPCQ